MAGFKTLFVTSLTDTSTSTLGDIEGIGTTRYDEKGNRYRYVKNLDSFAARSGGPAMYDLTNNGSAADILDECTVDGADLDRAMFAGVWMAAVPALGFGWIMTLGRYDEARGAVESSVTWAIGDVLIPSTLTNTAYTAASASYAFILGVDVSLTASDDTGIIFSAFMSPHVICLESTTSLTTTLATMVDVYVKGLV